MRVAPVVAGILVVGLALSATAGDGAHWGYDPHDGPEHWGDLSEDYAVCKSGTQQSPVDLAGAVEAEFADIELRWNPVEWTVVNNRHTIQVQSQVQGSDAGAAVIDGETYALLQFHFHTPSEHAIEGRRFAMEAHFVLTHADGRLAVIGVMIEPGSENDLFHAVMTVAPAEQGEAALGAHDAAALIPPGSGFLRYRGSLTTPPCSEVVLWSVMDTPIRVDPSDIDIFAGLFRMNARPLQPLFRRYVLRN